MNAISRLFVLSVIVAGLGACASWGGKQNTVAAVAAPAHQDTFQTDAAYIAQVENIARRHGVAVRWVNPPEKRVPKGN